MSIVMLSLLVLAICGGVGIFYGAYRLYRSGVMEDEAAERERLAKEAAYADEMEKLYPGATARINKDKIKKFSSRA